MNDDAKKGRLVMDRQCCTFSWLQSWIACTVIYKETLMMLPVDILDSSGSFVLWLSTSWWPLGCLDCEIFIKGEYTQPRCMITHLGTLYIVHTSNSVEYRIRNDNLDQMQKMQKQSVGLKHYHWT